MSERNVLRRQHGLFVSFCFVIGFIVGTGIFLLPGRILYYVGGDVSRGMLAWIVGGLMIAPSVYMFSVMASKYEHIHGFVDYSEALVGRRYGYLAGWFFAVMYQPAGYAIIAWITSGFTATLVGLTNTDHLYLSFRFFISAFFMAMAFIMNYLAPKWPVKFNVGTTVARMIPLVLMATVGVVVGLFASGQSETIATTPYISTQRDGGFLPFAAISATAFAFNGWQAALAFNSEVKDSKRKFPIALLGGFLMTIVLYVLYFWGLTTASAESATLMMQGGGANFAAGTHSAFRAVFGDTLGGLLIFFMIVSGLGILNACCLGMSRAMYALGRRGMGPLPERMAVLDEQTNVPNNSMVTAVGIGYAWLFVVFMNQVWDFTFSLPDFYNYSFFGMLVPLFAAFMLKEKELGLGKRVIAPLLAIGGAGFMFTTYWLGSPLHAGVYTATFVGFAVVGYLFYRK